MLTLYKCETRYDLMPEDDVDMAPSYDCYRGFIVAAHTPHDALFRNSLRAVCMGGIVEGAGGRDTPEELLEVGLPLTDKEWDEWNHSPNFDRDLVKVIWTARKIGITNEIPEGQIVITDFKAG